VACAVAIVAVVLAVVRRGPDGLALSAEEREQSHHESKQSQYRTTTFS
jgi:hypothetical protein